MPDWQIERGIGEDRLVRIEGGRIVEARIRLEGTPRAGTILDARLVSSGKPALARTDGLDFLLATGAPGVAEGATIRIAVTREPIPGAEPWKRPLAKIVRDDPAPDSPNDLAELPFPDPANVLETAGWSSLIDEARSGLIDFPGGQLRVSPTPAMTLIDVDGYLEPEALARAAASAAASAILRHSIGGSIGIDFPTLAGKAARQSIGEIVDAALPRPFERTAVNGFGFLQIVRPRRWASLFELAADRPAFEARALLRSAAGHIGNVELVAHPAVVAAIRPDWADRLGRQVGGAVVLKADPKLAMSAGHAH